MGPELIPFTPQPELQGPLILAFDLGTSSVRTALFDEQGQRCAGTTAQLQHSLKITPDGGAEISPLVLKQSSQACLEQTLRHYQDNPQLRGRPIIAIGVSCFWHSLLGLDENRRVITPIYTWADSRCRPDAIQLRVELSESAWHHRTGCMLRSSFWPAKLRWLRRTRPQIFKRVAQWISPADWIASLWCEKVESSYAMASGTGLFNPSLLTWEKELLDHCGISEKQLLPLGESGFPLQRKWTRRYPALANARWFPAIGDGAASNLGSGAIKPSVAAINIGTSAAIRLMMTGETATAPFGLFCYRVDAKRYLVGGAVSNAGNLREWVLRELRLSGEATELEQALERRMRPDHGLDILPFWVSERAPTWPEELPSIVLGLRPTTTALDILQATTEAVYLRLAQISHQLSPEANLQFIISGGVQNSHSALKRLANVLGQPVRVSIEHEASLRGAAVYALEKCGMNLAPLKHFGLVRPQKAIIPLYEAARRRQEALENLFAHWNVITAKAALPEAKDKLSPR